MRFSSSQLAQASIGTQIGGATTSAVGSYYSAATQKINLQSQAAISDINAQLAEKSAQATLQQGQSQIANLTLKAGQLKSSQRAVMAANGIDLGVGSAAEVQASTDLMKEVDSLTISANATRAASAQRMQSVNYQNDALMKRASADGINPGMSAFSSLLGSAGQVSSNWYMMNKPKTKAED